MKLNEVAGYVLTAAGLVGLAISLIIQTGEFDATALGISIGSIFVAIMGIALILGSPRSVKQAGS